jgi:NADPH:quinone reductase-like Zn-dependent oxidoreductase
VLAARFRRSGDPFVLEVEDVPEPAPPTGDRVLVQVAASSINGTDLGLRRGELRVATVGRLPFTPGFDVAGTVLACGPAVTAFRPGDRVMALLGHGGGGLAERVVLRQNRAALVPSSCSSVDAAALTLAGLTALQALHRVARLSGRPSAQVLVLGGAGGIGSFAVQLARLAGAQVTATARGSQLAFVEGLGADEVLDHRAHDVLALGRRWDVVLDTPGRHTLATAGAALAPGGVLVSTRPLTLDLVRSWSPAPRRRGSATYGAVMTRARSQDLAQLGSLLQQGRLHASVDRTFPLAQAAEAHRYAEHDAAGKVVITLPAPDGSG